MLTRRRTRVAATLHRSCTKFAFDVFPYVKNSVRQKFIKKSVNMVDTSEEKELAAWLLIPGIVFCRVVSRGLNSRVALTSICRNLPLCQLAVAFPLHDSVYTDHESYKTKLSKRRTRDFVSAENIYFVIDKNQISYMYRIYIRWSTTLTHIVIFIKY